MQGILMSINQYQQSSPHTGTGIAYTGVTCELTSVMTTFDFPSGPMSTNAIEITHETNGSNVETLRSRGSIFYFQCAVVVIGFVGTALNGLILYALLASKQHKKHVLIFNQNLLDFVSCFFLAISYLVKLCSINLKGKHGYWLCLTILSEGCSWGPFMSSMINLLAITIERYLKVVHPMWAKQKLRKWMIYSAMTFAWIGGTAVAAAATIPTTDVQDGVCYALAFWKSQAARMAYGIWYFMSFYVIILLIFTFCYGRIFIAIRHQARVMAAHSAAGSNTTQTQSKRIKTNVIKTMVLVSVLYAITLTPVNIYLFLVYIHANLSIREAGFFTLLVIGYVYMCINPFIYATNFDPVKHVLLRLIPCKNVISQPVEHIDMT